MKHRLFTRINLAGASERGVVLPVVIGLGLAMLMLVAVGMSSAASGTIKTNTDEDIKGAISAAYAGVEEYQSRLALDSTYYKFGNPLAPFSFSSGAGLTLPTLANSNLAFDATSGGKWAEIPNPNPSDPNTHTGSFFRYEVDNSDYASKGVIRLLSTGKVGNVTESVVASLRQSGFLDFLYFTDYETSDPIFAPVVATPPNCEVYVYNNRDSSCGQIQFGKFDTLAGPVHSNDTVLICSTTFLGTLTTSDPGTPRYQTVGGCTGPVFKNPDLTPNPAGAVNYEKPTDIPPTNSNMIGETYTDDPANVPNPGCLYTGPTTITFLGNGKMNVVSPYSNAVETNASQTVATTGSAVDAKCGKISDLRSAAGATINVLDLNLIYVQAVRNDGTQNSWAATATPSGLTCLSQTGTSQRTASQAISTSSGGFTVSGTNVLGTVTRYPAVNEILPWTSTASNPAYSCRSGDLYISGTIVGHMTAASDNYIYVTDDVFYKTKTSDILGLVPNNTLWIYNPILKNSSGVYSYKTTNDIEIDAALLSVKHTVQVQNYDGGVKAGGGTYLGNKGSLTIFGAIAQKFRGTVATSNGTSTPATGYSKNYQYDTRFHNTAPPKFLTPVSTTYKVSQYSGTKTAYNADGSQIP